jgi:hypothetical protein
MEITIKKEVEEKYNLELPYYAKSTCYAYKIISPNEVLDIEYYLGAAIKIQPWILPQVLTATPITKQEFNEIYQEVLTKLNQAL